MAICPTTPCERCRKPIKQKTVTKTQKYCSQACHYAAFRESKRVTVVCGVCSRPFETVRYKPRGYCSDACARKARNRHRMCRPPPINSRRVTDLIDLAPNDEGATLGRWLRRLNAEQFDMVWVGLIVEAFADGRRAALADALLAVKERYFAQRERALQEVA